MVLCACVAAFNPVGAVRWLNAVSAAVNAMLFFGGAMANRWRTLEDAEKARIERESQWRNGKLPDWR